MLTRTAALLLSAAMAASPALAQEPEGDGFEEGLERFSEGARRFIEEFAGELGPLLLQLERLMDEVTAYQAPEILDNGDIIIRRRPDTPDVPESPEGAPESDGEPQIEL